MAEKDQKRPEIDITRCPRCGSKMDVSTEVDFEYHAFTTSTCNKCGFEIGYREAGEAKELIRKWQKLKG